MNLPDIKRFSLPKFVGRFGTFAVDTFSTLLFFAMQGRSWVLITTGLIFAAVKIWHWQRSFNSPDELKRKLHRTAWCVMAGLSIYFLITLGVAITEPEPEEITVVNETAEALAKAVAESKAARINALALEQSSLLNQNASLTDRMSGFGQWSNAAADFRAAIDSNNERLGRIGAELTALYEQQAEDARRESDAKKEALKEKDSLILTSLRDFKPVGAPALLERVMPARFTGVAIRFLFFLIGVVMEITLALSSLPDGGDEKPTKERKPRKKETKEKFPSIDEVTAYIEGALQNDLSLLPDGEIPQTDRRRAMEIRKFISSFSYKGKHIIEKQNGRWVSIFNKENMKRFISIQYDTRRMGG